MRALIFDQRGIHLEYENNCLVVRQPELPPRTIPLNHISRVICLHSVQLTTSLLGQFWERKIPFSKLNSRYSERSFSLLPNQQKTVERRCSQYQWQQQESFSIKMAQVLCRYRLHCMLHQVPGTEKILIANLFANMESIKNSQSLNQLRGVEGSSQRIMFEFWRSQISPDLGFERRQRRPPKDPVNALLSLTYTLVMQEAIRQCIAYGLDSQLGFFHSVKHGRHSLACDIMEPVRPFCEAFVFGAFKNKTFNKTHFSYNKKTGACFLNKKGRQIYYPSADKELEDWTSKLKSVAQWVVDSIENPESLEGASGLVFNTI